jgi:uncharacterized delta-60 repeat protein
MPSSDTLRTGKTLIDVSGNEDSSYSAAITDAGRIWMVGLTSNGLSDDYAVVQLGDNGQRDYDYSQDAVDRLPQGVAFDEHNGLAGQPYSNILTSHIDSQGGGYRLSLMSVSSLPNGHPYAFAQVAIPAGASAPAYSSVQTEADSTFLASARSDSTLTLAHFANSGVLDLAFGDQGIATFALPEGLRFDSETPLALQANSQVVVAGHSYPGADADFTVGRYNADGTSDTAFGNAGTATFDIAGGNDFARALAVQADGKLLVAGTSDTGNGDFDVSVIRLHADGSLDTTFGDGGKATFDFEGGRDAAQTINAQENGTILITGSGYNRDGNEDLAALRLNPDGTLDTGFGDRADGLHITGGRSDNLLVGTDDDDLISGLGGKDLLDGGAGRDRLNGGMNVDVFRFSERDDSYRTADGNFSDRVVGFDPTQDALDLAPLGFTGLGDGHDNTLAVQVNASGTRTYLKSFDADANGHRFELALDGDFSGQLTASSIAFATVITEGDDGRQRIYASNLGSELHGNGGDDHLIGALGNDTLEGGAGRDVLLGLTGTDTFRYTALTDSYRHASHSFSDRILNLDVLADRLDVSALGFTGLGNGHNGTLAVSLSETGTTTYLKNYDANAEGQRFELTLAGDLSHTLTDEVFAFAPAPSVAVELLGVPEHTA